MNAIAKGRNLRISPLKLRKVVKVIRAKGVDEAMAILKILPNKAARMAYKVIHSALANFRNKFPDAGAADLKIETIFVDQAPILRRMMPRARGRADVLRKMSSHLTVVVGDLQKTLDAKPAAQPKAATQAVPQAAPKAAPKPKTESAEPKEKKPAPKAKASGGEKTKKPAKKSK